MEYFGIIIGAIFVSNIVLAQFLGICPFLGVSGKISTSVGMSGAVLFVMTLATLVTWLIYVYVLVPLGITFLQTISFILPGPGDLSAPYHHQLCCAWCGPARTVKEL